MLKVDTTPTLYTLEDANRIVATMNADPDDDWTYTVKTDPNPNGRGFCLIETHDEDGEFVSYL